MNTAPSPALKSSRGLPSGGRAFDFHNFASPPREIAYVKLPYDTSSNGGDMRIATLVLLALLVMVPALPSLPLPQQQPDVPAEIDAARRALHTAHAELDRAGGDWGGHKFDAAKHIDAALADLAEAEKWAREHHAR